MPNNVTMPEAGSLAADLAQLPEDEALERLLARPDAVAAAALAALPHSRAMKLLPRVKEPRRAAILAAAAPETRDHWTRALAYPEDSVGRLMDPPVAVFGPDLTVQETVEALREQVKQAFITYGYIVEPDGRLIGVLVMRELLLAERDQRLREIMLRDPFWLTPETSVADAMRLVLNRHYPVYPVCDRQGRLVGLVRGSILFEEQAIEISAQPGRMVGVEEEERVATTWWRSLRFRHPWLQLNLLTAFVAAAVVGTFEETINQVVVLAVFLPVLAGQSGNTGCQALAVTLRGLTLGELRAGRESALVSKEAWLGLLNGAMVGLTAGLGMFAYASYQHHPAALVLAAVVFLAMTGSCVISGVAGALVPLILKKAGADPATASSIFLTTATDVASMGLFLGLATWLVL